MASSAPPDTDTDTARPRAFDLTVNKVLAGAGASATAATVGSQLGAAGTVTGAAIGSVASTIATAVYLSSLERTSETVRTRLLPGQRRGEPGAGGDDAGDGATGDDAAAGNGAPGGGPDGDGAGGDGADGDGAPTPPRGPRRRWRILAAGVLATFLLGLLAVTGLEWAKGSTLSTDQPGTSIGRIVAPAPAGEETDTAEDPGTPADAETTDGAEPTSTGVESEDAGGEQGEDPAGDDPADRGAAEESATPSGGDDAEPTGGVQPTRAPSGPGAGATSNG